MGSPKLKTLAFSLFSLAWAYRLLRLREIIERGYFIDFRSYYSATSTLLSSSPNFSLVLDFTYGPPFILLPFIPFTFFSFKTAEYLMLVVNAASFYLVFYLLWKRNFKKLDSFFWSYLGLLAFSFPLVFSLSMGNPMGLVTLGIYSFWIFKDRWLPAVSFAISVILKIFPLAIIPAAALQPNEESKLRLGGVWRSFFLTIAGLVFLSVLIFPPEVWKFYQKSSAELLGSISSSADSSIYNQSFASALSRFGILAPTFSLAYWLFATALLLGAYRFVKEKKWQPIDLAMLLLALILLVHPLAWQYYFAIFLPFIILKLGEKKWLYLLPFMLLSLDGNRVPAEGVLKAFLDSSQFFGAFVLYLLMTRLPLGSVWRPRAS